MQFQHKTQEVRHYLWLVAFGLSTLFAFFGNGCAGENPQSIKQPMSGGETTVFNRTSRAYEDPATNLTEKNIEKHLEGDVAFGAAFVTSPGKVNPGLGPQFNNVSCEGCHIRNGRGMPVLGKNGRLSNLLIRVSLPASFGTPAHPGAAIPVPGVGTQLQNHAIHGVNPEITVDLKWIEQKGEYADGTSYSLRKPKLKIQLTNGKKLPKETMFSLRLPPPIFGLGLLEAVPEKTILALADPDDKNGDGISGRPNRVWHPVKKKLVLGRFSLKANQPDLLVQAADAFFNDMGISSPMFKDPNKKKTDIDQKTMELAAFYTQSLGVPARIQLDDPIVQRGEKLFRELGCANCHVEELKSGKSPIPSMANQTFHPYTDLLLHDMGKGLADNRPDNQATGVEWRTAPLWGIGATHTVLPYSGFLHDGRARTLAEAILWHGGEAEKTKEQFRKLPADDRNALIRFLQSL